MNVLLVSEIEDYINNISYNLSFNKRILKIDTLQVYTDYKQNQDITILINQNFNFIKEVNSYTRLTNTKLIVLFTDGINGSIFIDYGLNYNYLENNNYNTTIQNILNDGSIIFLDNHNLEQNDTIQFLQLEGLNTEFLNKDWEVSEIINNKTIKLNNLDILSSNFVFLNGTIKKKNKYITLNHDIFDENRVHVIMKNIKLLNYNKLITSFFSGLITFEIYKITVNVYKPLEQYFNWFEFNTIVFDKLQEINLDNILIKIIGSNHIGKTHFKNLSLINFKNINFITSDDINTITKNDIIISGLNTIKERQQTATECFKKNIPFFDCGISKNMGHIFPVIPYITETFENLNDFEYESDFLPCIINNFPYNQLHTQSWAQEKYSCLYTKYKNDNLQTSIKISLDLFNEYFNYNIDKLLTNFKDIETNFWSKGKKCPKIILFDYGNKLHTKFIELTVKIISNYNIKYSSDFIVSDISEIDDIVIKNKWINNCSKIRMCNYNILYNKNEKTNISTINVVSTLTLIEVIKYIINDTNYKSIFLNLSNNLIISANTCSHGFFIINENKINYWTKFKYEENTTLQAFKLHYEKLFNIIITMLVANTSTIIYSEELGINNLNKQLNEIITGNYFISLLTDTDIDLPDIEIIL